MPGFGGSTPPGVAQKSGGRRRSRGAEDVFPGGQRLRGPDAGCAEATVVVSSTGS